MSSTNTLSFHFKEEKMLYWKKYMGESITLAKTCGCMFRYVIIGTENAFFLREDIYTHHLIKYAKYNMKIMKLLN